MLEVVAASTIPANMARRDQTPLPAVLYEDDHLLALDKPSGLLIAPDRWDKDLPNLMQVVHERLDPEYANAHRLDRDASGVVLLAKHAEALRDLRRQFDAHGVGKCYVALTRPAPIQSAGEISKPLAADPARLGRMRVSSKGKESITHYEVLENWNRRYALLRLIPLTGRTHQLRVHIAQLGCPILGDAFYGDGRGLLLSEFKPGYKHTGAVERPLIGRLALHAQSLTFRHPATGQELTIESPLPKDFQIALKNLRRFAGALGKK